MKKIIVLLLTLALCVSTFVGCGCNTTNDNTTDTTKNEIESTTDDKEDNTTSDSGNVGDITGEDDTSKDDTSVDDKEDNLVNFQIWSFPTGDGFTEKVVATELDENADENWSYNKTYFLDCNGNVMTFKWDGPTTLGTEAWTNGNTLIMSNMAGEYALRAFTTGEETPEGFEELKSLDKDFVITCTPKDISYIENGYYNVNIGDDVIIFSFAIQGPVKGSDAGKGYAYIYVNKNTGASYQFYYLERLSNYDDARAWKVIESLEGISIEDFDTDEIKNFVE